MKHKDHWNYNNEATYAFMYSWLLLKKDLSFQAQTNHNNAIYS